MKWVPRRTKIVATLGPATDNPDVLAQLLDAGVNVVRLNFSHGDASDHRQRVNFVRAWSEQSSRPVAILADLQGPKIRVARFQAGAVELQQGQAFILNAELDSQAGDENQVGIDYPNLPKDCQAGDKLLLDDGRIVLNVTSINGPRIETEVEVAGRLSNNKGINRQGGGLSAPALTEKDKADIQTAAELEVDYVAVSFPRSAGDMEQARELLQAAGSQAGLVAKIERAETVADSETLKSLILASDAVMVARGDLGVEIGDAELMGVQKKIIAMARNHNRAVITATQMMETMISSPLPTRAEVMDVANAVLDGTDAVMLSAETAAGQYPVQTVEAMDRVIKGAERESHIHAASNRLDIDFSRIDQAIAMAAMFTANRLSGDKAIVCMTESGFTPLQMSRIRSGIPICAFSRDAKTLRKMALYRGVLTMPLSEMPSNDNTWEGCIETLKTKAVVAEGDTVIITWGDRDETGGTNSMKIVEVF